MSSTASRAFTDAGCYDRWAPKDGVVAGNRLRNLSRTMVECGSCKAPMELHEHPHSAAVPISARSTSVSSGRKDGTLCEIVENRKQSSTRKAVPRNALVPVLRYRSQCWRRYAQQPGATPNQRYWTISSAAMRTAAGAGPIATNLNRLRPCIGPWHWKSLAKPTRLTGFAIS